MGSVFGAVGLVNFAIAMIIGSVAWRLHSVTIWLIYPCVVMVLQGMAWLVAFMLRRQGWHGRGGGRLVRRPGLAMALFIDNMAGFVAAAGLGMLVLHAAAGPVDAAPSAPRERLSLGGPALTPLASARSTRSSTAACAWASWPIWPMPRSPISTS